MIEILQEMFGEESVPKIFKGEKLFVAVDGKKANINLKNLVCLFIMLFRIDFTLNVFFFIGSNLRR